MKFKIAFLGWSDFSEVNARIFGSEKKSLLFRVGQIFRRWRLVPMSKSKVETRRLSFEAQ